MSSWSPCPQTALAAAGVVGQWEIDVEARTVKLDRAGAKYRYGDDSLAGTAVAVEQAFSVIHPEDRARVAAYHAASIARGGPFVLEHRVIQPGLGLRHLQVRGYFGLDERGRTIGRGIFMDVSETSGDPVERPYGLPTLPRLPYAPLFDPLTEAAAHGIEVREALGQSGHGALRLAADLLLFEINTALAEQLSVSDKSVPEVTDRRR